ncbi:MAG: hypothetical protein LAT83_02320 [Kiritimatiellae bacterium]|nr:hypothetical protein [Kiritimatiellia bacterium]
MSNDLPNFLSPHDGKVQILSKEAFCALFSYQNPRPFLAQLDEVDKVIRDHAPHIHQGAFNNVHGAWYEWIPSRPSLGLPPRKPAFAPTGACRFHMKAA